MSESAAYSKRKMEGAAMSKFNSAKATLSRFNMACRTVFCKVVLLIASAFVFNLSVISSASAVAGVPQASTVFTVVEDFQNLPTASTSVSSMLVTSYTGASPINQVYTADPVWLTMCNGLISAWALNPVDAFAITAANCGPSIYWNQTQFMAYALAAFRGDSVAAAKLNYAITAYTRNTPGANKVVLQTTKPITISSSGKYLTLGLITATQNCGGALTGGAKLSFQLVNSVTGAVTSLSSTTGDTCNPTQKISYAASTMPVLPSNASNTTNRETTVGRTQSTSSVLGLTGSYNLVVRNANGATTGNDWAFDDLLLLDSTPQLDKAFSPTSIAAGATSTLTFTITNTTELASKLGWSFTDALPSGLVVAATPTVTTTCTNGVVTAIAGSSSISVQGDLNTGQVSCTASVRVTAATSGSYVNGASNITSSTLLLPPDATLTVTGPNVIMSKTTTATTVAPSAVVPFVINLGNSGTAASPTTITVTDVLPAGMMATSTAVGTGVSAVSCTNMNTTGATLTCTVTLSSAMAAGSALGTAKFTINTVAPSSVGTVTNYAAVSPTGAVATPTPGASCTPTTSCGSAQFAVVLPNMTTVTIKKISTGGTGSFVFSGDNGFGSDTVTTTTQGVAAAGVIKTLTSAGLATTLTETLSGYALVDASCTGMGAGGIATVDKLAGTVVLDAAATVGGSNIVCTFTNSAVPFPTLTIKKISTGGVGIFNFTGDNGFGSDSVTTTVDGVEATGVTKTLGSSGVATTITETSSGYVMSGASCTGMGAGGTAVVDTSAGTVKLDAAATASGSNIVCTFTNVNAAGGLPNVILSKSGSAKGVVGSVLPYTISLGNSGAGASGTTLTVYDQLPAGVSAYSAMASTGVSTVSCTNLNVAGALLACTVKLKAALSSSSALGTAKFTINTRASAAGTVVNYASVSPTGGTPPTPGSGCSPAASCDDASTVISEKIGSAYW